MAVKSGNLGRREFVLASSAAIATPFLMNAASSAAAEKTAEKKKTYIINSNCIGCHHCFYSCPQSAIHWGDDKYEIDQKKCIQCGTCYNTCNISAVEEKK
jgi:ferredoxin